MEESVKIGKIEEAGLHLSVRAYSNLSPFGGRVVKFCIPSGIHRSVENLTALLLLEGAGGGKN
jgi:hypothetical protein